MSSPHLERALRIKTNSYRGGVIENIWFRKVTIGQVVNDAVQIDFSYEEGEGGPFQPAVRNIYISDVTAGKVTTLSRCAVTRHRQFATCGSPIALSIMLPNQTRSSTSRDWN